MYSSVHGNIGAITFVSTYELTGCFLAASLTAFFSHYLLDMLDEKGYKNIKSTIIWELTPFLLFLIIAHLSGLFWLGVFGWVLANGMDLVDKKMYLTIFFPNKYKSTFYFHKWKPLINFNLKQTKIAAIVSAVLFLIFSILIK